MMKFRLFKQFLLVTATLFMLGTVVAFAHGGGYGYGHHMRGHGAGSMMDGCYGEKGYGYYHNRGKLSQEQIEQLEAAREKFFEETQSLRERIRKIRLSLGDEMAKENPDEAKVIELQKELSQLQSDFDQKAIQHHLEVRKIAPDK